MHVLKGTLVSLIEFVVFFQQNLVFYHFTLTVCASSLLLDM